MTFDLGQPQIVAAGVSAIVAAIVALTVALINLAFVRGMHKEKLDADHRLAESKVAADMALAERKFALDAELSAWKRRYELCEQALTVFYQAKDALNWARRRVIFGGEGESRVPPAGEDPELTKKLNSAYVPIERLNDGREVFAKLQTLRLAFTAHFGRDLNGPFMAILEVHGQIATAARILMEMTRDGDAREAPEQFRAVREQLGWGVQPDDVSRKIDGAVAAIEAVCRPVLTDKPGVR